VTRDRALAPGHASRSVADAKQLAELTLALKTRAAEEGFAACGVCAPEAYGERLRAFVAGGLHGEMDWLARRMGERGDPRALWPAVRSVVMLAESYTPAEDPMQGLGWRDRGVVSAYARGGDYHDLVKKRLKRLGRWFVEAAGAEIKVFVDTAPVMEKPLAEAAGIGWQGKHTNLLSRELGNWLFLGAIFTDAPLPPDPPEREHCGSCRACLDVCPTQAFDGPWRLDPRRCVSYLTIEHKGPAPEDLRAKMGNRIYGCDDCLAVCPWNKFAAAAQEIGYAARAELRAPRLADLAALDDAGFREVFAGSPIKRIGRDRMVRNVLYAIGNSADQRLRPAAERLTRDPDPVVRDAAEWALRRLQSAADAAALAAPRAGGAAPARPSGQVNET
jgi:epoxyqueuosine reductase